MQKQIYLYFDESGNLGSDGRFFVIACILTENPKEIQNIMKKTLLQIKKNCKYIKTDGNEIKAKDATPEIKKAILNNIIKKDIDISYIVADKLFVLSKLKEDKNCLYNFLLKILLDNFKGIFRNNKVHLILDNKTIKVKSLNSFKDYINIHLNYELKLNIDLSVEYRDSKAKNAFNIQAVDYIANGLYSYYEYGYNDYKKIIDTKLKYVELFPKCKFGEAMITDTAKNQVAAAKEMDNKK